MPLSARTHLATTIYGYYRTSKREHMNHRPWHEREYRAQAKRQGLAWQKESFWSDNYHIWKYHFTHVSTRDPSMLAYTANDKKGERDIQTPIKPGRYLKQFFGTLLDDRQIKYYVEWHLSGTKPKSSYDDYELKFASEPDEIAAVYVKGVYSCMRDYDLETHPCRAYGAGDLSVAYLEGAPPPGAKQDRTVIARAILRPSNKAVSSVYPKTCYYREDGFLSYSDSENARQALIKKLRDLGYSFYEESHNNKVFSGAKLLKIPRSALTYVDSGNGIKDAGDHLVLL